MPAMRQLSHRAQASIALAAGWLLFFADELFSSGVPYYRDHLVTNVPLRHYVRERLLSFELPQWYPYESLGVPVIGQIALGTFHPLNLLTTPLPAVLAEKLVLLAAYAVGLAGAYRFARALGANRPAAVISAFAYAFGGFALGLSCIIAYALSVAALPWVGWAACRVGQRARAKDAVVLGAAWACVFLAGDAVSYFLMGGVVLAVVTLGPSSQGRALGLAVAGGLLSVGWSAVELLPATAVAADSVRNAGVASATLGSTWALHPLRLFELIVPGFVPDPIRGATVSGLLGGGTALFVTTMFAGVVTLLLALLGAIDRPRLAWRWLVIALVAVLLALGDRTPLYKAVQAVVPLLAKFRYPERYMAFFWVALVPLVGWGATAALARLRQLRWLSWSAALALGGLALAASTAGLAGRVWSVWGHTPLQQEIISQLDSAWARGLAQSALAAGLLPLVCRKPILVSVLIWLELWAGNGRHMPLAAPELLEEPTVFATALERHFERVSPRPRVVSEVDLRNPSTITSSEDEKARWIRGMRNSLRPNAAGLEHVTSLGTNLGALSVRHVRALGQSGAEAARLAGRFNACAKVTGAAGSERVIAEAQGQVLVEIPCAPRARFAEAVPFPSAATAAAFLRSNVDPLGPVPWEGQGALRGEGRVVSARYAPERIELEVEVTDERAAPIIADEYAVGWSAAIDGAEVPIHPAMVTARGLAVPKGRHTVTLAYATPRLGLGASLTALTCLVSLALLLGRRRFF